MKRFSLMLIVLLCLTAAVPVLAQSGEEELIDNTQGCTTLAAYDTLSGPETTLETDHFLIHYTTTGVDAATPAYAAQIASVVDGIWEAEIDALGWPAPPPDCGEGGDTRYDIYLMEVEDQEVMGMAVSAALIGDNPASTLTETYAGYSFLLLDNDFSMEADPLEAIQITMTHEFFHAIQMGYDTSDPADWMYESTAVWMETQVIPDSESASGYTPTLFDNPDLCLGAVSDDPAISDRIYAEWLLIDSIVRDYGPEAVRRLWELAADREGMDVFYALAEELGDEPYDLVLDMAIRNLLLDYEQAPQFEGTVFVEGWIEEPGVVSPGSNGVQELAVDYVGITYPGAFTIGIDQPDLLLQVIAIDSSSEAAIFYLQDGDTVDVSAYEHAYLIILNPARHDAPANCTTTDWTLTITPGDAANAYAPNYTGWPAPNFVPAG
jgi:hypothetical protein